MNTIFKDNNLCESAGKYYIPFDIELFHQEGNPVSGIVKNIVLFINFDDNNPKIYNPHDFSRFTILEYYFEFESSFNTETKEYSIRPMKVFEDYTVYLMPCILKLTDSILNELKDTSNFKGLAKSSRIDREYRNI